eukprot:jgi/Ulvmu1/8679/UM047_0017.1
MQPPLEAVESQMAGADRVLQQQIWRLIVEVIDDFEQWCYKARLPWFTACWVDAVDPRERLTGGRMVGLGKADLILIGSGRLDALIGAWPAASGHGSKSPSTVAAEVAAVAAAVAGEAGAVAAAAAAEALAAPVRETARRSTTRIAQRTDWHRPGPRRGRARRGTGAESGLCGLGVSGISLTGSPAERCGKWTNCRPLPHYVCREGRGRGNSRA